MKERFGIRAARTIGVAVVSLLLIVGGAFAADQLASSGPGRDDASPAASVEPGAIETHDATDDSASPEATEAPEATEDATESPDATDDQGVDESDDASASPEAGDDNGADETEAPEASDDHGADPTDAPEATDDSGGHGGDDGGANG